MNRFKLFTVLILSLNPAISFAQDKPELDLDRDVSIERQLIQEESRILSEILQDGQVDEAFIKGYPKILRETLRENSECEKRIRVLGQTIETGLIYQNRFDVITEDELKGLKPGDEIEELERRIESSPVTGQIRDQVRGFQNQIFEQTLKTNGSLSMMP